MFKLRFRKTESRSIMLLIVSLLMFSFMYESSTINVYAEENEVLKVRVIEDNNISAINGKYIALDITCEQFLESFDYNDIVTITVNGNSYDAPVCCERPSTVFSMYYVYLNNSNTYMFGENFDHIYLASKEDLLQLESGVFNAVESDDTIKYVFNNDLGSPLWAEIKLKEKGGFSDYQTISGFVRTAERDDYPDLSDEGFANFRMITAGDIKNGILYRSSSPIDPVYNRNIYADAAAQKAGIRTIINLADSQSYAESLEGYYNTHYSSCDIYYANMPLSFRSDDFRNSLKESMRFMCEHQGPYLIHCAEGKYRTGVIAALIECFMGADITSVQDDFIITYENFYDVQNGTHLALPETLRPAVTSLVRSYLCTLFDKDSLDNADLAEEAYNFMKELGLTDAEITKLRENLSDNISTVADTTTVTDTSASENADNYTAASAAETKSAVSDVAMTTGLPNTDSPNTGDEKKILYIPLCLLLIDVSIISASHTYRKEK